jgi:AcrR family transcriptional regulator
VDAAREIVAADGPVASLDRIARQAGVGSATLYRHFGNRDALLNEVFRNYTADLAAFGTRSPTAAW